MLEIVKTINGLRFSELMYVYNESNALNGSERYPDRTVEHQLLEAEQDFYLYLTSVFFRQTDSFYAVHQTQRFRIHCGYAGTVLFGGHPAARESSAGFAEYRAGTRKKRVKTE